MFMFHEWVKSWFSPVPTTKALRHTMFVSGCQEMGEQEREEAC